MHHEQRQQTIALLEAQGISCALFAHIESVTWLTGFTPPIQLGQHHFSAGPPLVWYADRHFYLVVLDWYVEAASRFEDEPDGSVIGYEGYRIDGPIVCDLTMTDAFRKLIERTLPQSGNIGVEKQHITALFSETLHNMLSSRHDVRAIDRMLVPSRMIKTAEELEKLRRNFALTDIGHAIARTSVAAGKREIDVWMDIHSAINSAAGMRVPLGNDLVVGSRTPQNIGGWPLEHELREGDTVTVDLSTALDGYWSDSCAAYFVGERNSEQQQVLKTVTDALEYAVSLIRPGVAASHVDAKVRQFIEDAGYPVYPHHTGHGVGTGVHEEPRIVPYNDTVLQAGMVLMLEPGIYFPGKLSIRLEDGLLVTADGAEVLTTHDKS